MEAQKLCQFQGFEYGTILPYRKFFPTNSDFKTKLLPITYTIECKKNTTDITQCKLIK